MKTTPSSMSDNLEFGFEKLLVWQKSRTLVRDIYHVTNGFPETEKFGLANQLRRASISVCSNIAEGSSRSTGRDKARFYELAYGSLIESLNQVILCHDLEFISTKEYQSLYEQISEIAKMLSSLRRSTQ